MHETRSRRHAHPLLRLAHRCEARARGAQDPFSRGEVSHERGAGGGDAPRLPVVRSRPPHLVHEVTQVAQDGHVVHVGLQKRHGPGEAARGIGDEEG